MGELHVFYGPMKSGKTKALLDWASEYHSEGGLYVKPATDTRSSRIFSRDGLEVPCRCLDDPAELYDAGCSSIFIDEAQFFPDALVDIIEHLTSNGTDVVAAGLDLDYRGEPFGPMPGLMRLADKAYRLVARCSYGDCDLPATHTQRLINGKPAPYDDGALISIEGSNPDEVYEPRCSWHHVVPKSYVP